MGTCSSWVVFTDKHFHPYSKFLNVNSPFLKWKKMIDSSPHGWFFLFWTFHIWYKVMRNTCYIFLPLFFFIASVKLVQFLRLLQIYLLYYYYSNVFRQNATKKITCENCGKQTKRSIFWRCTRCSTGRLHFTQRPNFSTTSQTYLAFLL